MKEYSKSEIKVGATVLIGLIAFLVIFSWAKNLAVFKETKTINILFDSVAGLETGDAISINGVKKGYVEEIKISGNKVLVKSILDNDIDIREDAKFSILMLDLMGGKKIEVNPGSSANKMDYNKEQTGYFLGDISTAMAMLSTVQNDLVDIIREIKITLIEVNKFAQDTTFKENIKSTLSNIKKLTAKMTVVVEENRSGIKDLVSSGIELSKNASGFIDTNKEQVQITLAGIKTVLDNGNSLIQKISSLTDETTSGKNNIGKLLYDENLISDLKESIKTLKELTKIFLEQIKKDGLKVDAKIF